MEQEASQPEGGERTLSEGREVLRAAARCLGGMADQLDESFVQAVELLLGCQGQVVLTGIGKAGIIAAKISATLASTGTPSIFLHPVDALHGDLGRVGPQDVVLALSNSGTTNEITRLIQPVRSIGAPILAITAEAASVLASEADVCLCFGKTDEAGHLGLAPTTSTTAMLALGDALAMAVLSRRHLSPEEFARYHPAGALGRSLMRVEDVMRQGERNPVGNETQPLFEILRVMSETPGRPGAASLVDGQGRLTGFYTDGDFRRNMEAFLQRAEQSEGQDDPAFLRRPVAEFMTRDPRTIRADQLVGEAVRWLSEWKIDQLPVVDDNHLPIGLIDVQDLLGARILG